MYRIESPWNKAAKAEADDYCAWELVSKDKNQAVVTLVWNFAESNCSTDLIKLQGLDKKANYVIHNSSSLTLQQMVRAINFDMPASEFNAVPEGSIISGEELMYLGLLIVCKPQYGGSVQFILEKV